MKRIRCPKCDAYQTLEQTRFKNGQSLVFICPECGKQFGIKIRKKAPEEIKKWGSITVIENVFAYKQVKYLVEGENCIGRRSKGTKINQPIETSDMSMDRIHCFIYVEENEEGEISHYIWDAPSLTGTFVKTELLNEGERKELHDGDVVSIGATTFIFRK